MATGQVAHAWTSPLVKWIIHDFTVYIYIYIHIHIQIKMHITVHTHAHMNIKKPMNTHTNN